MELALDRHLSDRRIFPAFDIINQVQGKKSYCLVEKS